MGGAHSCFMLQLPLAEKPWFQGLWISVQGCMGRGERGRRASGCLTQLDERRPSVLAAYAAAPSEGGGGGSSVVLGLSDVVVRPCHRLHVLLLQACFMVSCKEKASEGLPCGRRLLSCCGQAGVLTTLLLRAGCARGIIDHAATCVLIAVRCRAGSCGRGS